MNNLSPKTRRKAQLIALTLALLGAFGGYAALQTDQTLVAMVMGIFYLTAMFLTILAG